MTYMIGIDSGGTHIVATAWAPDGQQRAQVTAGPGNIFLDQANTLANLDTVIADLMARFPEESCSQILVGIAGVETTGNADAVAAQLTAAHHAPTAVISDAQLALLNGLEGADGTLVIAGTGSIVKGRQAGRELRYGGWGQLLGDTGSAYKIASTAMIAALAAYDQGRTSALIPLMQDLLHAPEMKAAVKAYYGLSREKIAAFAAHVAKLADTGDADATAVLTSQAQALGGEIIGLLRRYSTPTPMRLACSGSVLVNNASYRAAVVATVAAEFPAIAPLVVTTNNSRGVLFWHLWQH